MSLYSIKQQSGGGVQPWAAVLNVGKALKDFYTSLGDVTLTGANTVVTLLDGPEKVVRYGNLTLGDGTTTTSLTASQRCKGLTIICDALTVKANATLHMTGRGARVLTNDDPLFPFIDFRIPNQITLSSDRVSLAKALSMIRANGWALWDQGTMQHIAALLNAFDWSISQAGTVTLLGAAGCGGSVDGVYCSNSAVPGNTGSAGISGGTGSGGTGGAQSTVSHASPRSGKGSPYSGGSGSGSGYLATGNQSCGQDTSEYSGGGGNGGTVGYWLPNSFSFPGEARATQGNGAGGAGNPRGRGMSANALSPSLDGSEGVGGKLTIICYGSVTVHSGGKIEANGMPGGNGGSYPGGGGSGGGHISIITSGSYTNSGTVQAAGGSGGTGSASGGAGGAGSVVTKSFSDMGW